MKKLDLNGSKLCSYQAEVFSNSVKSQNCSSMIFLRRFFLSDFAQELDKHDQNSSPFDVEDCFSALDKQFKKSEYGSKKINENVMHWVGYITRYICYTREITSKYLYKNIPLSFFVDNYYVCHTQGEEWVIDRITELNNLPKNFFNNKAKIKATLRKLWL